MKFFTPEAIEEFEDFERYRAASEGYRARLNELRSVLPAHVLELAKPCGMENGLVVCVLHDRESRRLSLTLRCGDLQMGYYDLVLEYYGAEVDDLHDAALGTIARNGTDFLYQEFDVTDDGRIEHRMIFRPAIWFAIRSDDLEWKRIPKADRQIPSFADRYPGGPG